MIDMGHKIAAHARKSFLEKICVEMAVLNRYFQGYSYPTSSQNYMFARTGYVTRGRKRSFLSPSQLGGDSNRVIYILIRYLIITSNELWSRWGEVYISLCSYSAAVRGWGSDLTCLYGDLTRWGIPSGLHRASLWTDLTTKCPSYITQLERVGKYIEYTYLCIVIALTMGRVQSLFSIREHFQYYDDVTVNKKMLNYNGSLRKIDNFFEKDYLLCW